MEEKQICEFELDGVKCCEFISNNKQYSHMGKISTEFGIARCKRLCPRHFNIIVKDNIKRFNKGITIPDKIELLKTPSYNRLWAGLDFKNNNEKGGGN